MLSILWKERMKVVMSRGYSSWLKEVHILFSLQGRQKYVFIRLITFLEIFSVFGTGFKSARRPDTVGSEILFSTFKLNICTAHYKFPGQEGWCTD
jgi:hypothetical protein